MILKNSNDRIKYCNKILFIKNSFSISKFEKKCLIKNLKSNGNCSNEYIYCKLTELKCKKNFFLFFS